MPQNISTVMVFMMKCFHDHVAGQGELMRTILSGEKSSFHKIVWYKGLNIANAIATDPLRKSYYD